MVLNPLRVFLVIAELGSVRAAARSLGITQPAVSKALRKLEDEFGVPLFVRDVRGVQPTTYGTALLARARLVDAELRRGAEEIAQIRGQRGGTVSVALSHVAAALLLPRMLPRYREAWPDVALRVAGSIYPYLLSELRQGALDFAIIQVPPQQPPEGFAVKPLSATRLVPVVRDRHPQARARTLADLAKADWLLPSRESSTAQALSEAFARQGLPPPVCRTTCETLAGVQAMLEHSDLVGVLPEELFSGHRLLPGLTALKLYQPIHDAQLCLLTRAGTSLTPAAQALADLLAEALPQPNTKGGRRVVA